MFISSGVYDQKLQKIAHNITPNPVFLFFLVILTLIKPSKFTMFLQASTNCPRHITP